MIELKPDSSVVDALRGEISEPIQTKSCKPGSEGRFVEVRLVLEGPGMFGLTNWKDNKEWAGIFNHSILTGRYAVYFAQQMAEGGYNVNPQRILDGMIVSHAGRRQWDEAFWYPEVAPDAKAKREISNETLGMYLVQGKVSQDAFELVVALGHNVEGFSVDPTVYNSWDFKTAIYVDHRTTQKYEPLNTRMGDFLLGNFFERGEVTPQLKEQVYASVGTLIAREKNSRLGCTGGRGVELDEADRIAADLGARPNSTRLARIELMRLILQDADTEAELMKVGIDPDILHKVPMPGWEHTLRLQYVEAARESMMEKINTEGLSDEEFPVSTWWGQYARQLV